MNVGDQRKYEYDRRKDRKRKTESYTIGFVDQAMLRNVVHEDDERLVKSCSPLVNTNPFESL
jgi:hypothetical protein